MENNLEDLKKEFESKFAVMELVDARDNTWMPSPEFPSEAPISVLWQWFKSKLNEYVPKSEYNSVCEMFQYEIAGRNDLTIKNIGLTEQIAELKAENERLVGANIDLKQATHTISEKCLSLQDKIEMLEATIKANDILSQEEADRIDTELIQARHEERARIVEIKDELERRLGIIQSETDDFTRQAMISNLTAGLLDAITADQQGEKK